MFHYAVLVNALAVVVGASVGITIRRGLKDEYRGVLFTSIALVTLGIGIKMALKTEEFLIVLAALVLGSIVGEVTNIEGRLEKLANFVEKSEGKTDFVRGFVTSSLLFLVGPMTILGSISIGTTGNAELILIKSLMDGLSSIVIASVYGYGVMMSAAMVYIVQGLLVSFAKTLEFLSAPHYLNDFTGLGGLMIMAIGIRMLEIKEIKVGNMLPALIIVVILDWLKLMLI